MDSDRAGFSLVELLMVVAIVMLLMTSAIIGFNSIVSSSRMEQAGRMVVDEFNIARQTAAARNANVEIRFILTNRPGTSSNVFWQMESGMFSGKSANATFVPFRAKTRLPEGIIMAPSSGLSSILGNLTNNVATLTVRPNGILEPRSGLSLSARNGWFITLVPDRKPVASINDTDDFITIQVDPITTRTTIYRP